MGDSDVGVRPTPTSSNISGEDLQCTICLSAQFAQECRVDGCNHSFCFSCISEWVCQSLRPSCPMCRKDVDKVFYEFAEHKHGQKEIGIREYRSGHMSLTPTDRAQLLSERRLVVRNLMHAYKVVGLLSSDISEIEESKEPDEMLKNALIELLAVVTQHIQKAEMSLCDLRTELARKNKSLVFNTLTFRRMVYTNKIKIKYPAQKRSKSSPPISKHPDRLRDIVTNFLVAEFDAIPFQNQPKFAGHKWRTKFLGANIDLAQKQRYAAQIYDLMLVSPAGNADFQKALNEILSPVSAPHIQFLDDHLEAITAIEKTNIEEFYNEVYYDSIYNSFSNNYFDYNSMMNMRDDPQSRFEAIFSQLQRDVNPAEWVDTYGTRLFRQTSNTDGTDRATNNDDDSDRSESPEERVPTPMPDDDPREQSLARAYFEQMLELPTRSPLSVRMYLREHERSRFQDRVDRAEAASAGQTTRTLPITQQPNSLRSHMTLRSSARRERELAESSRTEVIPPVENRPQTRREYERDQMLQRVREFDTRSQGLSSQFRSHSGAADVSNRRFVGVSFPGMMSFTAHPITSPSTSTPVYYPRMNTSNNNGPSSPWPRFSYMERRHRMTAAVTERIAAVEELFSRVAQRSSEGSQQTTQPEVRVEEIPLPPPSRPEIQPTQNAEDSRSLEQIAAAINQEDADNGLDFISVAHRTRSARRAAQNGQLPGAPPAKRSTNSRRDRH